MARKTRELGTLDWGKIGGGGGRGSAFHLLLNIDIYISVTCSQI